MSYNNSKTKMKTMKQVVNLSLAAACLGCVSCVSTISDGLSDVAPKKIDILDECRFERYGMPSKILDNTIRVAVVLPPEYAKNPDKKYPVLYTLHGYGAPYATFAHMSPLRKALKNKPMIVTCFEAGNNYYIDSPDKRNSMYTKFFFEEFIPFIDANYRIDPDRRALTGFSMGGFGSFHYALTKPEMFKSASSLSGAFPHTETTSKRNKKTFKPLLGPYEENKEKYAAISPFLRIAEYGKNGVKLPPFFLHCGDKDFLLEENREMRKFLKEQGQKCEYLESPGAHNWTFWKNASKGIIDFHWQYFKDKK